MLAGTKQDDRLALAAYMYQNPPSGATAMWYWPIGGWQKLVSLDSTS
jgi:hypothetical protein